MMSAAWLCAEYKYWQQRQSTHDLSIPPAVCFSSLPEHSYSLVQMCFRGQISRCPHARQPVPRRLFVLAPLSSCSLPCLFRLFAFLSISMPCVTCVPSQLPLTFSPSCLFASRNPCGLSGGDRSTRAQSVHNPGTTWA